MPPKSPNAGPKHGRLSTSIAIFVLSCVVCTVRSVPLVQEAPTLFFLRCLFVLLASLVSTLISARHLVFPPPIRPRNCYGANRNPSCDGVGLELKSEVCPLASGPRYVLPPALFGTTYLVSVHPRRSGLLWESVVWTPLTSEPLPVSDVSYTVEVCPVCVQGEFSPPWLSCLHR